MKKWLLSLTITLLFSFLNAENSGDARRAEIERCLLECYRVDLSASEKILEKLEPLIENEDYSSVLDTFIAESRRLDIYSSPPQGGEESAPSFHSVLFENDHLRISWAVTKSGEQEPFLAHPWKTLMVIVKPSQFYSETDYGIYYEDDWPIGVYILDPSLNLFSCRNIGLNEYNGLVFEIKTAVENGQF